MRKILPYILILIILVGLFSPMAQVKALDYPGTSSGAGVGLDPSLKNAGTPNGQTTTGTYPSLIDPSLSTPATTGNSGIPGGLYTGLGGGTTGTTPTTTAPIDPGTSTPGGTTSTTSSTTTTTTTSAPAGRSAWEQQMDTSTVCFTSVGNGLINVGGCLVAISYYLFYVVPSFLLTVVGEFFNAIVAITLSSTLFAKSFFVSTAWAVVRDLSNIFFILILLYIAIKTILGLGGHEAKLMIRNVIIVALLINFSMFFTQIVIDSSNILALIFYNKLDVPYGSTSDSNKTGIQEKDMSGKMVSAFDPASQSNWNKFFNAAKQPPVGGLGPNQKGTCSALGVRSGGGFGLLYTKAECDKQSFLGIIGGTWAPVETGADGLLVTVPSGIMITVILATGAMMLFAAYCFFVAGISFLGRLIELWILIIFSPFAFTSSTVPRFASVEYIGWEAWFKRLIATSFMAPIFMFFMYLIVMLVNANPFGNLIVGTNMAEIMLLTFLPVMVILLLLMKATKFAKEGGGQFGEMMLKGAKMAGGLALGAATGGTALVARGVIGGGGGALVGKLAGGAEKMGFKKVGRGLRDVQDFTKKSSFDVRNAPGVGTLAKAGGMNLGTGQKGGWTEMKKQQVEKRQKRVQQLEERGSHKEKENVEEAEGKLKQATLAAGGDLEKLDEALKKARANLSDATKGGTQKEIDDAKSVVDKVKFDKAIATGAGGYSYTDPETKVVHTTKEQAGGIADMENQVRTANHALQTKKGGIRMDFAQELDDSPKIGKVFRTIGTLGAYSGGADRVAARKIRAETKIDSSGGKEKGENKMNAPKPLNIKIPSAAGGHPTP